MSALTNQQKGLLAQLYRRAFDYQVERGAIWDAADFTDWRHEQQFAAVGKMSLRSCTQGDFAKLMAHGLDLAGDTGNAFRWHLKAQTNPERVALAKLKEACAEAGVEYPSYPLAICWDVCKCRLEDATEKQVWRLVYTVRNRRKRGAGFQPAPPQTTEVPA